MINYQNLLASIPEKEENILNLYQYGSHVYGTATADSDWDFVAIVAEKTQEYFLDDHINILFFTPDEFHRQLIFHEISTLECLYLPDSCV